MKVLTVFVIGLLLFLALSEACYQCAKEYTTERSPPKEPTDPDGPRMSTGLLTPEKPPVVKS